MSSLSNIWDRITDATRIPEGGTPIRPFVRKIRLQVESFYSDSEKQVVEMKEKVVDNVKDVQENRGKQLDELVPSEVKKQRETWRERFIHVNPKTEIKVGIAMAAIAFLSRKRGPRVFIRNTLVGGTFVAAYFYPNALTRTWNKVPVPTSIRIETRTNDK